eukprot:1320941-Amphidinium_carterae.2
MTGHHATHLFIARFQRLSQTPDSNNDDNNNNHDKCSSSDMHAPPFATPPSWQKNLHFVALYSTECSCDTTKVHVSLWILQGGLAH